MAKTYKKGTHTRLFLIFLLAAGIASLLSRSNSALFNSLMFCLNFSIYTGLLLFWSQTLNERLLPTMTRLYIRIMAFLMFLILFLRVFKYRVVEPQSIIYHYFDYLYWVPEIMIPTLFLMIAVRIRIGEGVSKRWMEGLLLIPSSLLCLMALTNDLHFFVYIPKFDVEHMIFVSGSYTYGFGFILLNAWMALAALIGILFMIRSVRLVPGRSLIHILAVLGIWVFLELILVFVINRLDVVRMYNSPEIRIFGMLAITEICIRSRLIPHNENHITFFENITLPVMISDRKLRPVYRSAVSPNSSEDQMRAALSSPVSLDADTKLYGMELPSGAAFWTENEAMLHKEERRLASAVELLSEENDLIAMEHSLKEKKARLDAEAKVYEEIAAAIYPKQKRIEELLKHISPEDPEYPKTLALCCVLNAWSKRKSNLLLLREETLAKRNRELFLAIQESARFLGLLGIEAAAVGEDYSELSLNAVRNLYDTFETVIEECLPYMKRMTVSLTADGLRIAMETSEIPPLPDTPLPVLIKESDEIAYLTISGGERSGTV